MDKDENKNYIGRLPVELIYIILLELDPVTICEIAACCRQLRAIVHAFQPREQLKVHLPQQSRVAWPNTFFCQWIAERHYGYTLVANNWVYFGNITTECIRPIRSGVCSVLVTYTKERKTPNVTVDCYGLEEFPNILSVKFPNRNYTVTINGLSLTILVFRKESPEGYRCMIRSPHVLDAALVFGLETNLQCTLRNLRLINLVVACTNEKYRHFTMGPTSFDIGYRLVCERTTLKTYTL